MGYVLSIFLNALQTWLYTKLWDSFFIRRFSGRKFWSYWLLWTAITTVIINVLPYDYDYIQHDRYVPAQVSDTGKRAMTHRAVALCRAIPLAPKAAMIRCFATTLDGVIMIRLLPRTSDGAAEPWLQC